VLLSYLLWEIHNYPDLPTTVEIDQEGYKVINGWQYCGNADPPWSPLSNETRNHIEEVLEQVDYWKWERFYDDPNILDGTTWSIKVRTALSR